jgi:L-threonylcarbamoyladenylate synthase
MSRVYPLDPTVPGSLGVVRQTEAVAAAVAAILAGRLVVLPTETVYGIACRPDDPAATARLFAAKRRPAALNLPLLAPDDEQAWHVAVPDGRAVALASAFWPGPLTLILPRTEASRAWELGEASGTVGVRVPDHPIARAVMAASGPAAATSANVSGLPPLTDGDALVEAFGDAVDVYLTVPAADPVVRSAISNAASTVVDLTGHEPRVLREGPVTVEQLGTALRTAGEGGGPLPLGGTR